MVNPSPTLTMKQSSRLLQFFKSWHQPPQLSPRDSQKLLTILKTSFREKLAKEHGEFRKDNLLLTRTKPTPNTTLNPKASRHWTPSEPLPPTDRHFQAILLDPLFTTRKDLGPDTENLSKNPMDVFEMAVSKGLMTMDKCRDCLFAEKSTILRSSKPTVWQGMKDSGAGLKALRWLKASGLADTGQYLTQNGLFGILAQFVAAEGLQEVVWSDFEKLCASLDSKSTMAARPLIHMVEAEMKGPKALDAGIFALIRAASILQHSPEPLQQLNLRPSARMLSYHCTVLSHLYAKLKPSSFEELIRILQKVLKARNLFSAQLYLHHPTNPSPQQALIFFKKLSKNLDSNAKGCPPKAVINLGLDTARYLLEHDQMEEARGILEVLQSSFPDQLGIDGSKTIKHAKSEAGNLELLQGLSFA